MRKFVFYIFVLNMILFTNALVAGSGPVAEYKMDECFWDGTEGEIKDSSGNSFNATAKNGANTDFGKLCMAGEFDGDDDYIDTGHDFHWSRDDNFTISVWVNIKDVNEYDHIPIISKPNRDEYSLMIGKRDARFFYSHKEGIAGIYIISKDTHFESGKWYHIAVTYNGDTKEPKIYVNAKDKTYIRFNEKDNEFGHTNDSTYIGSGFAWGNEYFKGKIDEVKIYNRTLSSEEINRVYMGGKDGKSCTKKCMPKPLMDYRMDECSWGGIVGEVKDSSLNGYDGTARAGLSKVTGKLCEGGTFDGEDDYIELPQIGGDKLTNGLSITAWAKFERDKDGNWERVVELGRGARDESILFSRDAKSNNLTFEIYHGGVGSCGKITAINGIVAGELHHYAVTLDRNRSVKIYRDGVEIGSGTSTCLPRSIERTKNFIGKSNVSWGANFKGRMDEVKIFDRPLTSDQIKKIYRNENDRRNFDGGKRVCKDCSKNLLLNYRMDECSWSGLTGEVKDSSGKYNGTARNGAKIESGKLCRGGKFNRDKKEYIDTGHDFNWNRDSSFTIMAWVQPRSINCPIVSKRVGYGADYQLIYRDDRRFAFYYAGVDDRQTIHVYTASYDFNNWYHVAVVYDGYTKDVKLYVNGKNSGHVYKNYKNIDFKNSADQITKIAYGYLSYHNPELNYCDGKIDEVKIFDNALDSSTISLIYNREKAGKNWDEEQLRECPTCFAVNFNAWDLFRDVNDQNISTKIVGEEFNLTIASLSGAGLKDFNGTVCVRIIEEGNVDNNYTALQKVEEFLYDANKSEANFNVSRAIRKAKVQIVWKDNVDIGCDTLVSDSNSSKGVSVDNFAVRPKEFNIKAPDVVYAGEEFNLTFEANSSLGNTVVGYNERKSDTFEVNASSIDGCIDVNEKFGSDWSFSDGLHIEELNITNIGEINITISEINGSEFAVVDADDTDDINRTINKCTTTTKVYPYKLKLKRLSFKSLSGKDWAYMANDIMKVGAETNVTIDVLTKDNRLIKDFNETCYGEVSEVRLQFNYEADELDDGYMYKRLFDESNKTLYSDEGAFRDEIAVPLSKFSGGEANVSVKLGVARDWKEPKDPVKISLNDVNISNSSEIGSKEVDGISPNEDRSVRYYYGRLKFYNIKTRKEEVPNAGYFLVYSSLIEGFDEEKFPRYSVNWYINTKHSEVDGKIDSVKAYKNTKKKDRSVIDDINVTIGEYSNGFVILNIKDGTSKKKVRSFIHLDINSSTWLWNGHRRFSSDYSFDEGSDCTSHPCFKYVHIKPKSKRKGVVSGAFRGSDFDIDVATPEIRRGAKTFR